MLPFQGMSPKPSSEAHFHVGHPPGRTACGVNALVRTDIVSKALQLNHTICQHGLFRPLSAPPRPIGRCAADRP